MGSTRTRRTSGPATPAGSASVAPHASSDRPSFSGCPALILSAEGVQQLVDAIVSQIVASLGESLTPTWMTAEQAADYTHIKRHQFKRIVATGVVPRYRFGRKAYLYNRHELDAWLHEYSGAGAAAVEPEASGRRGRGGKNAPR